MTYNVVALMPMRHTSMRVPGKNYRPFGDGRLLFQHTLDKLLACKDIDKVVINTDSPTIREECAKNYGDSVIVLERPEELLGDMVPMNDILAYDVTQVDAKFYLQTHSTNPLVKSETFSSAISTFLENYPIYDSLFSVTRLQTRLWDQLARPVNHNQNILLRTQDLPPLYEENSCIYIFRKETLLQEGNRIGRRPYLFEIEPLEAVDIDEEHDFIIAEKLFEMGHGR